MMTKLSTITVLYSELLIADFIHHQTWPPHWSTFQCRPTWNRQNDELQPHLHTPQTFPYSTSDPWTQTLQYTYHLVSRNLSLTPLSNVCLWQTDGNTSIINLSLSNDISSMFRFYKPSGVNISLPYQWIKNRIMWIKEFLGRNKKHAIFKSWTKWSPCINSKQYRECIYLLL